MLSPRDNKGSDAANPEAALFSPKASQSLNFVKGITPGKLLPQTSQTHRQKNVGGALQGKGLSAQ